MDLHHLEQYVLTDSREVDTSVLLHHLEQYVLTDSRETESTLLLHHLEMNILVDSGTDPEPPDKNKFVTVVFF